MAELKNALKQIAESMQKKIDQYAQQAKELRIKELQKSEGEVCDICGYSKDNCECSKKLEKVTPPRISEQTMHKLKNQYGGDKEKAYATAWKIHNTKKSEFLAKNATMGYGPGSAPGMAGAGGMAMSEPEHTGPQILCKMCKAAKGTLPSRTCANCKMAKCDTDHAKPLEMGKTEFGDFGKKPDPKAATPMEASLAGKQAADKQKTDAAKVGRSIGRAQRTLARSEDWLDMKHENEKGKRLKNVGQAGTTPDDKKVGEPVKTKEGSGGDIKPNGLEKADIKAHPAASKPPAPKLSGGSGFTAKSSKDLSGKFDFSDTPAAPAPPKSVGEKTGPGSFKDILPKPAASVGPSPGKKAVEGLKAMKSEINMAKASPGFHVPVAAQDAHMAAGIKQKDPFQSKGKDPMSGFTSITGSPSIAAGGGTADLGHGAKPFTSLGNKPQGHVAALRSRATNKSGPAPIGSLKTRHLDEK